MKTFVYLTVLLVAAYSGFAQDRIINRIDRQTGEKSVRIEHRIDNYARVCLDSKVAQPANAQSASFEISMDKPNLSLKYVDYGSISGHIKNLTSQPLKLVFFREQTRQTNFDSGWTTSVCFGDLCYPAETDFLPANQAYTLTSNGQAEFKLNITSNLSFDDSILIHVVIAAVGSSEEDTVGLWMSVKATDKAAVSTQATMRRSTIQAVYPSPLISGTSVNVQIAALRELGYRYTIVDPFGREVAFGTSQRKLTVGDNVVSISSLEGLVSGSYLLKVNFSDGTSDAYPFTVVR